MWNRLITLLKRFFLILSGCLLVSFPIRQVPGLCNYFPIWWIGLNWIVQFHCRRFHIFSSVTYFLTTCRFLWTWLYKGSAFPWSSSNPSFHPAPTPDSFTKFIITQSRVWTRPPLQNEGTLNQGSIKQKIWWNFNPITPNTWWEKAYAIARSRFTAASSRRWILARISSIVSVPLLHSTCTQSMCMWTSNNYSNN